jgi:hypothetical protein
MTAFLALGMWFGAMTGAFVHHLVVGDVNNKAQNIVISNITYESAEGNSCMEAKPW